MRDEEAEDAGYVDAIPNDGHSVVRIYNAAGCHVLSFLPCGVNSDGQTDCVDLATPQGKVLFWGVRLSLVDVFVEHVGIERIEP
jgi:hypothetical protein